MSTESPAPETQNETAGGLVRWLALVVAAGVAIALLMTFIVRSVRLDSPVPSGEGVVSADQADFRLPVLGGGESGPPDYAGKVVVIDFWATWCGPCRLQAEFLEAMYEDYSADDVQFLAVNVGEDLSTVRSFVESTPFPYPVLMDEHGALSQRYQVFGLPLVMVIDKRGAITWKNVGVADRETLEKQIARAGVPAPRSGAEA